MGLVIQTTSNTLLLSPILLLLQLVSTSPIYFILKPQLNQHSASLFSAFSSITVTLKFALLYNQMLIKPANLVVDLASTHE